MRLILTQPQLRAFDTAGNLAALQNALAPYRGVCAADDIIVLPEHFAFEGDADGYRAAVTAIAAEWGCHVVGGSHHETRDGRRLNTGIAVSPAGDIVGRYDKLRPYSDERKHVEPGELLGEFRIGGTHVLVLVCADFWFGDLFYRTEETPDLVLVPALSVTRKSTPDYSRDLWRHLAVARAYEFGVYVGISDWGFPSALPKLFTSGVGGFADPTGLDPNRFFTSTGDSPARVFDVDLAALRIFREDRKARGFFWKSNPGM